MTEWKQVRAVSMSEEDRLIKWGVPTETDEEEDNGATLSMDEDKEPHLEDVNPTIGQQLRALNFWKSLDRTSQHHMNRISRPIGQDLHAGLPRIYKNLYKPIAIPIALLLFARVLLNIVTIAWTGYKVFKNEVTFGPTEEGRGGFTKLTGSALHTCFEVYNSSNVSLAKHNGSAVHVVCQEFQTGTLNRLWMVTIVEFFFTLPVAIAMFCVIIGFLCGCRNLPRDRPWFFMFAPNVIAGFSGMIFLGFLSTRRWKSLWGHGEFKLWSELFLCSVCPHRKGLNKKTDTPEGLHACDKCGPGQILFFVMFVLIYVFCIIFSIFSFIVKFKSLHFLAVTDISLWFGRWDLWFRFLGFLNQLVGAISIWDDGMARLFLAFFGGWDCTFQQKECIVVAAYMSLIAGKTVDGKIAKVTCGSLACVSILSLMDSDAFQKCLLSPLRERRFAPGPSSLRRKLLTRINDARKCPETRTFMNELKAIDKEYKNYMDDTEEYEVASKRLEDTKQKYTNFLLDYRGHLLDQAITGKSTIPAHLPDDIPASTLFTLVSEVQNYKEDVDALRLNMIEDDTFEMDDESEADSDDDEHEDDNDDQDDDDDDDDLQAALGRSRSGGAPH